MEAQIQLKYRDNPLQPTLVVARTGVVLTLARRLLRMSDEALSRLHGARWPGGLVLRGETEALPWVDGVCYLAESPQAAGLWLPTTMTTRFHPALVQEALLATVPGRGAIALLRDPAEVLPIGVLGPVHRSSLRAVLETKT